MRLIDADKLIENAELRYVNVGARSNGKSILTLAKTWLLNEVDHAPTVEAKPVVYCKDCKYNVANRQQDPLDITDYTDITCEYFMTDGMSPNDYCSQGVKIPVISMEDVPNLAKEMEK